MAGPIRLVTYAWGKAYVDRLLEHALSAALAPGNLPALAREFDCTAVIVTEESLFAHVRAHPVARQIEAICPLRLVPLDDLITEPWQYGMTLAYALFRGFSDLGSAMTDTTMLFLNADFILADGSYRRLMPRLHAGERILLSPSYCVVEEEVGPLLAAHRDPHTGVLAVPPRRLAELIVDHRHNTIRAKTVNQRRWHYEYMDQFYWLVDDATLIGHQMPISLIAMRPERALDDLNTFWDWGIVYEFCPSRRLSALEDSDEFLMMEMRAGDTYADLIRVGESSPGVMASKLGGHITQYQVDNARFPLILHAGEIPADVDGARQSLRAFRDSVLSHLPSTPIDHRDHAQWVYHKGYFERYRDGVRSSPEPTPTAVAQPVVAGSLAVVESSSDADPAPPIVTEPRAVTAPPAVRRTSRIVRPFGAAVASLLSRWRRWLPFVSGGEGIGPCAFRRLGIGPISIVKTRTLDNLLGYSRRLERENTVLVQRNRDQEQQLQEYRPDRAG